MTGEQNNIDTKQVRKELAGGGSSLPEVGAQIWKSVSSIPGGIYEHTIEPVARGTVRGVYRAGRFIDDTLEGVSGQPSKPGFHKVDNPESTTGYDWEKDSPPLDSATKTTIVNHRNNPDEIKRALAELHYSRRAKLAPEMALEATGRAAENKALEVPPMTVRQPPRTGEFINSADFESLREYYKTEYGNSVQVTGEIVTEDGERLINIRTTPEMAKRIIEEGQAPKDQVRFQVKGETKDFKQLVVDNPEHTIDQVTPAGERAKEKAVLNKEANQNIAIVNRFTGPEGLTPEDEEIGGRIGFTNLPKETQERVRKNLEDQLARARDEERELKIMDQAFEGVDSYTDLANKNGMSLHEAKWWWDNASEYRETLMKTTGERSMEDITAQAKRIEEVMADSKGVYSNEYGIFKDTKERGGEISKDLGRRATNALENPKVDMNDDKVLTYGDAINYAKYLESTDETGQKIYGAAQKMSLGEAMSDFTDDPQAAFASYSAYNTRQAMRNRSGEMDNAMILLEAMKKQGEHGAILKLVRSLEGAFGSGKTDVVTDFYKALPEGEAPKGSAEEQAKLLGMDVNTFKQAIVLAIDPHFEENVYNYRILTRFPPIDGPTGLKNWVLFASKTNPADAMRTFLDVWSLAKSTGRIGTGDYQESAFVKIANELGI